MAKYEVTGKYSFIARPELDRTLSAMPKGYRSRWINANLLKHVVRLPEDRHYDEEHFNQAVIQVLQFYDELKYRLDFERYINSPEFQQEQEDMAAILAEQKLEKGKKKEAKKNG